MTCERCEKMRTALEYAVLILRNVKDDDEDGHQALELVERALAESELTHVDNK